MNQKVAGNPEALKRHKDDLQRQTRQALEQALERLRNGKPQRVKHGTSITAATVAKEAGVDRSTLYRNHEPVLTDIRKLNDATPKKLLAAKRGELEGTQAKVREYRAMVEELQAEMTAWARQNYALNQRIHELEGLIRQRNAQLAELQKQWADAGKIVALKPVPAVD